MTIRTCEKLIRRLLTALLLATMMAGSCAALRTRMEIRIGVSEQMAPYQFLDNQEGQLAGIHYDLLKSLETGSDDSVIVLYFD